MSAPAPSPDPRGSRVNVDLRHAFPFHSPPRRVCQVCRQGLTLVPVCVRQVSGLPPAAPSSAAPSSSCASWSSAWPKALHAPAHAPTTSQLIQPVCTTAWHLRRRPSSSSSAAPSAVFVLVRCAVGRCAVVRCAVHVTTWPTMTSYVMTSLSAPNGGAGERERRLRSSAGAAVVRENETASPAVTPRRQAEADAPGMHRP